MNIDKKVNLSGLKGVLFDLDGTILDSMPWHIKAWQEILTLHGVKIKDEFLYLNEGAIESAHLLEAIQEQGLVPDAALIQTFLHRQAKHFNANFARFVTPFSDTISTLDRFREMNLELALITSSSRPVVNKVLEVEVRERFSVIVTGDEVQNGKPHPEPYRTGLEKLGLQNGTCLAVENAPAGIRSAKAAGLICAALTTTLTRNHLDEADVIFGSLTEMADFLACRQE